MALKIYPLSVRQAHPPDKCSAASLLDDALRVAQVCCALRALCRQAGEHSSVSTAVLLADRPQCGRSAAVGAERSARGEVIARPEVQRNIPQRCGRPSHNHSRSDRNAFCLQS